MPFPPPVFADPLRSAEARRSRRRKPAPGSLKQIITENAVLSIVNLMIRTKNPAKSLFKVYKNYMV